MRVGLLCNPNAGAAGQADAVRAGLAALPGVEVVEPPESDDLRERVRTLLGRGCDVLAVAGGDGTIHGVVNALSPDFPKVRLLVIPLGTGNDLCRTLAVPTDPLEAIQLLRRGRTRAIDAVRVSGDWTGYAVNAATGGFSGRVAADVTSDLKAAWGPLAYLRGAAGTIADPPAFRVSVRYDDGPPVEIDALNLVVANARTAAGGFVVAPRADVEDGRLDVVVVAAGGGVLDRTAVAARLMAGDYVADAAVTHRRAKVVEIRSDTPIPFSIDGELAEGTRFTFAVVRRPLRVYVGPDYRRIPRLGRLGNAPFAGLARRFFGAVAATLDRFRGGGSLRG